MPHEPLSRPSTPSAVTGPSSSPRAKDTARRRAGLASAADRRGMLAVDLGRDETSADKICRPVSVPG